MIAELDLRAWVPRLEEELEPVTVFIYTSHPYSAPALLPPWGATAPVPVFCPVSSVFVH